MNATKFLIVVLLLVGVGAGVFYFQSQGEPEIPIAPRAEQERTQEPQRQDPVEARPVAQAPVTQPQNNDRVAVRESATTNAGAAQGVTGRVVMPGGGTPAADVAVYLLQSSTADPLSLYLAHRRGQKVEPVAEVRTGQDGRFRIGVEKEGQTFDLRVVSESHPEIQHKSFKVRAEDWYDTGDLELPIGAVVVGKVIDEAGKFPIPGATVYLTLPGMAHQMLPTPGRERGIEVRTDSGGFFRYDAAPRDQAINLAAQAPEYATTELQNLQVKGDQPNEFTLELARGEPIRGLVTDAAGKPVANASILAAAQSAKVPQSGTATSGSDGRFELQTLRPGPYQLTVTASNYEEAVEKPVFTGGDEVHIVLEQRGLVRLKVLSARGQPLKSYTVGLKRYFANNPGSIGKVPEFRDVRVTPKDYTGEYASIRGVPNGEFVFQILEGEHAKTLTPNFTMSGAGESPTVEVQLTMGASVSGRVLDEAGRPIVGATVASDMNGGVAVDTGFFEMFRSFLPDKHTSKTEKTDRDGRFRLSKLAFADYMLRIAHPDYCEALTMDVKLEQEGQELDVGDVRLRAGALVEGVCRLNGRGQGQIKVMIGPPQGFKPELDSSGKPLGQMFTASAITDSEGNYRFMKRVPPGTYKIHAFKEAGNDDVFGRFKQMKETERPLIVAPGQDQILQNFDLSQ